MNDVTYTGTADPATAPAGIYTATAGDARAVWIVTADKGVVGVTSPNSGNGRELIDKINAEQKAFKDKVRQAEPYRLEDGRQPGVSDTDTRGTCRLPAFRPPV